MNCPFLAENKINEMAKKMEKQFAERATKKPAGGVSILPERKDEPVGVEKASNTASVHKYKYHKELVSKVKVTILQKYQKYIIYLSLPSKSGQ